MSTVAASKHRSEESAVKPTRAPKSGRQRVGPVESVDKPKGGTVFDPSMGFGGRLIGFIASHCSTYVGTDPAKLQYEGNSKLVADLMPKKKKAILVMSPVEDWNEKPWTGKVDLVFTSPPYFCKEKYSEEPTQSWKRYTEFDGWLEGFMRPMIKKARNVLKPKGILGINVQDVKMKQQVFPLVKETVRIIEEEGFVRQEDEIVPMRVRFTELADPEDSTSRVGRKREEPILMFKRG